MKRERPAFSFYNDISNRVICLGSTSAAHRNSVLHTENSTMHSDDRCRNVLASQFFYEKGAD